VVYTDRAPSHPIEENAVHHQGGAVAEQENSRQRLLHDALAISGDRGVRAGEHASKDRSTNSADRTPDKSKDKEDETDRRRRPLLDRLFKKDKPDVKKDDGKDKEDDSVKVEKEGGVEQLKLPKGFTKGAAEKEDNYMEFPSGANKDLKVCYWKRNDYAATDDDTKKINDIMKKPPHELKEQEILDLIPTMAPGRWAGNGNFKQLSLRTEDVGGKRVIVGDFKFNDQDKKVHVMIANPDKAKQQIELLWFEGPNKEFDAQKKALTDSFHQIKWTDVPSPPAMKKK
jgi:hypothetical protein